MRGSTLAALVSILLVSSVILPLLDLSSTAVEAQGEPVAPLGQDMVYLIQGPTSANPGVADRDINIVKLSTYVLPHNVSRLYSQIPHDARDVSIVNMEGASVGWETTGPMAGMFYYDVPSSYPRNDTFNHTEAAVEFPASQFENLEYSSGSAHLRTNATTGTCFSSGIPVPAAYRITSANVSVFGTNLTNVSTELSNDGGSSWFPATGSEVVQFTSDGLALMVKLTLVGNTTTGGDPKVTGLGLHANYIPLTTTLTLHISYIFTPDYIDGHASINLTEPVPYSSSGMLLVFAYIMDGYKIEGQGIGFISGGPDTNYPGKQLYFNMTYVSGESYQVSAELYAPQKALPSWALFAGIGSIALVSLAALGYGMRRRQTRSVESAASALETEEKPVLTQESQALRHELIARKKGVLNEMEMLRTGKSKKDAARLGELKQEYKSIRNELNRLNRDEEASGDDGLRSPQKDYQATLEMLKRIDDDFERGVLPSSSHESLRKKYLSEAARLKQEIDSGAKSRADEKLKLMEAIVALEEERGQGKIDQKVFEELNASYRKELEEVIKRTDEGGEDS